jgi:hypothetical protein
MAKVIAILTTCWRLVKAIDEIVAQIEQTHEDARALTVSVGLSEVWQKQISHHGVS